MALTNAQMQTEINAGRSVSYRGVTYKDINSLPTDAQIALDASVSGKKSVAPVSNAAAVTPSDSTDLPAVARSIYVGGGGNLKVDMADGGTAIILTGVLIGVIYNIAVKRVYSTGTTATNIVALY